MSPRRRSRPAQPPQPRLADSASAAAEQILRRKLDPHRIASYGEIREYHTRRRWWLRRWIAPFVLLAMLFPVNHSLYVALTKHQVVPAASSVAPVMNALASPLVSVRRASNDADWWLGLLDRSCDAVVRLALGQATLMEIVPMWTLIAIPLLTLAAYSLSPGLVWWGFRLCAIEFMAAVYSMMEFLYAPLVWFVDRSRTAREFYEGYYDVIEWID